MIDSWRQFCGICFILYTRRLQYAKNDWSTPRPGLIQYACACTAKTRKRVSIMYSEFLKTYLWKFWKSDPEILTNLFDKNELPRHQGNDHIRYDLEWNIKNYDSCRTRFAYTADPLFNIRRTTGHRKICNIRIDPKSMSSSVWEFILFAFTLSAILRSFQSFMWRRYCKGQKKFLLSNNHHSISSFLTRSVLTLI